MKINVSFVNSFIFIRNKSLFKIIEKFDFIYPYYQLAGYYLEKIKWKK